MDRGTEPGPAARAATGTEGEPGIERGDNRPITWVTEGDRLRKPGNRSLYGDGQCEESGETDPQSRELRLRERRLILRPSRCRFCCCCCWSDDRMDASTRCLVRLRAPSPCHPLDVHLPRSGADEKSLALSVPLVPCLHSHQLMSHRAQRCAAILHVTFPSSALPPISVLCRPPFAGVD